MRIWIAVLDQTSPATVRALKAVREVTVDGVVTTDDVPTPDGRWPVAADDDGLIFQGEEVLDVWDPETQEFVETLPGPFPVAVWRNRIVTCGPCDQLNLIDLEADTLRTIDVPVGVASVDGYGGAFSPDGRYVAVPGFLTMGQSHQKPVRLSSWSISNKAQHHWRSVVPSTTTKVRSVVTP